MILTAAVTGGIGAGKSTVSTRLAEHGARVIDSDRLAREVVAPGSAGLDAIAREFGPGVIGNDRALDRAALAAIVFADPAARRRLESITHPAVRALFAELRDAAPPGSVVVNDIPLLVDLSAAASFQLVIGVFAGQDVRVGRLIGRGLSEADARARIASQIPDGERRLLCDALLGNDGRPAALVALVDELWAERLVPMRDNIIADRPAARCGPALVGPDPDWPADAVRIRARISRAVRGARVDHVGSTAIPGFPARDVIDLQLTAPSLDEADSWHSVLTATGFPRIDGTDHDATHPAADDPTRGRERLHRNADPARAVNVHVRVLNSPAWRWSLLFRDWLIDDAAERAAYVAMKRQAAAAHAGDRTSVAYGQAKKPWMAQAYPRGLAWAERTGWQPGPASG